MSLLSRVVPEGGTALALARSVFVGALLSSAGVLLHRAWIRPRVAAASTAAELETADRALRRLETASLAVASAGLAVWTVLQSAAFVGTAWIGAAVAAVPTVLRGTQFGHLVLLQAAALGAATALARRRAGAAALAGGVAVALQAGHGHGMAMGGLAGALVWIEAAHLLAAAGWVGGLAPLLLVVCLAPPPTASLAARFFSPVGEWCVVILACSALLQGGRLIGSLAALFGTAYGWVALLKTACFGVLLGLAVLNRHRLAPGLRRAAPDAARRRLVASIAAQTVAGVLAVLASGWLSGLVPGMDMGRPS